jgi:acyl carrier protein
MLSMGLDGVEIVMEVEDEFGIIIPDPDVERIMTVGGLADYVQHRLDPNATASADSRCGTSRVFYAMRRVMMNVLGVDRAGIRPTTPLASVVPYSRRSQLWEQMELAGVSAPALRLPADVQVGVIALAGVFGFALLAASLLFGWNALILLCLAIPVACCASVVIMRTFNAFLPKSCVTVGDLARASWLTDREPERHSEIFDRVATIIAEQMNIPKESLRRETRFRDILWD